MLNFAGKARVTAVGKDPQLFNIPEYRFRQKKRNQQRKSNKGFQIKKRFKEIKTKQRISNIKKRIKSKQRFQMKKKTNKIKERIPNEKND